MTVLKSTIFKHVYFDMTDCIADSLIKGILQYDKPTKQYFGGPEFEQYWLASLNENLLKISKKFGLDEKQTSSFFWFFERMLPVNQSVLTNLLHQFIFNPYAMSPVLMMYMVSKTAMLEYKRNAEYSLDKIFADHLARYNSLLDYPLSDGIISSMKKKFYQDENKVKTNTMKWFTGYRVFQGVGFAWLNNDENIILNNYESRVLLSSILGSYSFSNIGELNDIYTSCKNAGVLSNSIFRLSVLDRYFKNVIKVNQEFNLSFFGVGVVSLLVQALFDSVSIDGDRVDVKNILNSDQFFSGLSERETLLDVSEDFALFSRSDDLNVERLDVIGNHDLILGLISASKG